jgi:hypothetical protein
MSMDHEEAGEEQETRGHKDGKHDADDELG